MKAEPIKDYLRRRLNEVRGEHNRIARETGVSQSSVSRIHLGECSPTLDTAQRLIDWFDGHDKAAAATAARKRRPAARKSKRPAGASARRPTNARRRINA